jgi:transcriptional regulator with XRE-family HTH domain
MESIYTAEELEFKLGESLKRLRLQKNLDRQTLCDNAGISMNALRHLEAGQGVTTRTLIRVVRALGRQDWLESIAPTISINPLHLVRSKVGRQRASRKRRMGGGRGKVEKASKE